MEKPVRPQGNRPPQLRQTRQWGGGWGTHARVGANTLGSGGGPAQTRKAGCAHPLWSDWPAPPVLLSTLLLREALPMRMPPLLWPPPLLVCPALTSLQAWQPSKKHLRRSRGLGVWEKHGLEGTHFGGQGWCPEPRQRGEGLRKAG